MYKITHKL